MLGLVVAKQPLQASVRACTDERRRGFTTHVSLVDTDQPIGKLKHVIPQRYDDELSILGALFDVVCNYAHVLMFRQIHTDVIKDRPDRR